MFTITNCMGKIFGNMLKHSSKILSYLFCAICIIMAGSANAQEQERGRNFDRFSDRLFFGGSFGLAVGSRVTQIDVAPMMGLWIFPEWSLGLGGRYSYRRERFSINGFTTEPIETHVWGVSGFTQVIPITDFHKTFGVDLHGGVILHAEFESLYLDRHFFDQSSNYGKGWVNMYLVGGGWHQPIGDRAAINFLVLWDLTDNRYSPYNSNPILRFTITF